MSLLPHLPGQINHLSWTSAGKALFIVLASLLFFPFPESVYSPGIDTPLPFVFDYLIHGQSQLAEKIIFPHGPLAFLMYPLPGGISWWIAVVLHLLLRSAWAGLLVMPVKSRSLWANLLIMALAIFLSGYLSLATLLPMTVLLLLLKCGLNPWYLLFAAGLAACSFFVKSYSGILCLAMLVAWCIIRIKGQRQEWLYSIGALMAYTVLVLFGWTLLFGHARGLPTYLRGLAMLASGNSVAVALYPINPWLWIGIGLLGFLLFLKWGYLWIRARGILLMAVVCFLVWKYAIAREDYLHTGELFNWMFFVVLVVASKANYFSLKWVLSSVMLILSAHMVQRSAKYYTPSWPEPATQKLWMAMFHYRTFSDSCQNQSAQSVKGYVLPRSVREIIGNSAVDEYPFDYSAIAANRFHWQPRPVIQSYAAYQPGLDRLDSLHFASADAPEYLWWDMPAAHPDPYGGYLGSIDGRYLLNDEPMTLQCIMSRYERYYAGNSFVVFRKRQQPFPIFQKPIQAQILHWDQFAKVPSTPGALLAKVNMKHNAWGKLKSALYKDAAVYALLRLQTGEIRRYRIVPQNAACGLWISPLIMDPITGRDEPAVDSIAFITDDASSMQANIMLSFIECSGPGMSADGKAEMPAKPFFGINPEAKRILIGNWKYGMMDDSAFWSSREAIPWVAKAKPGHTIGPDGYSAVLILHGDTLYKRYQAMLLTVNAVFKAVPGTKGLVVITMQQGEKQTAWLPFALQPYINTPSGTGLATFALPLSRDTYSQPGNCIKVFFWNADLHAMQLMQAEVFLSAVEDRKALNLPERKEQILK